MKNQAIFSYQLNRFYLFIKKRDRLKPISLVGVTGIEPATSWSQTTRAPICATPRSTFIIIVHKIINVNI